MEAVAPELWRRDERIDYRLEGALGGTFCLRRGWCTHARESSLGTTASPHQHPVRSMKFQLLVRCGRRPDRKELRVGPQMACWQYLKNEMCMCNKKRHNKSHKYDR